MSCLYGEYYGASVSDACADEMIYCSHHYVTKYDDCNETDKNTLKKLNGIYGRVKVMVK